MRILPLKTHTPVPIRLSGLLGSLRCVVLYCVLCCVVLQWASSQGKGGWVSMKPCLTFPVSISSGKLEGPSKEANFLGAAEEGGRSDFSLAL